MKLLVHMRGLTRLSARPYPLPSVPLPDKHGTGVDRLTHELLLADAGSCPPGIQYGGMFASPRPNLIRVARLLARLDMLSALLPPFR